MEAYGASEDLEVEHVVHGYHRRARLDPLTDRDGDADVAIRDEHAVDVLAAGTHDPESALARFHPELVAEAGVTQA